MKQNFFKLLPAIALALVIASTGAPATSTETQTPSEVPAVQRVVGEKLKLPWLPSLAAPRTPQNSLN